MALSEFLLARIAEDELTATVATPGPWSFAPDQSGDAIDSPDDSVVYPGGYDGMFGASIDAPDGHHIARWNPARVLAECEAKRWIVATYIDERTRRDIYQAVDPSSEGMEQARQRRSSAARCRGLEIAVEALALPYADHPDYREEWKP